jgi:hypothetical protein
MNTAGGHISSASIGNDIPPIPLHCLAVEGDGGRIAPLTERVNTMKEYTVQRFAFSELSESSRETAISKCQDTLHEYLDEREITDYLRGEIEGALGGYPDEDIEIAYSLSYCQGDGVAIYGMIRRADAPDLTWPEGAAYVTMTRNSWGHHYSHYNSFSVDVCDEEGEIVDDSDGTRIIETQLRDLCRELERAGYKYIEGMTSREAAIEYLENEEGEIDPLFLENGERDYPKGTLEEVNV